jgi:hypothetical protein
MKLTIFFYFVRVNCTLSFFLLLNNFTTAQYIGSDIPEKFSESHKFLFYLHGGVVTVLGNNAINQSRPEWGPYEYLSILDSLQKNGFNIISEIRKEGINNNYYIHKIVNQIETLLRAGVKSHNLLVVGASAGGEIALHVAANLNNQDIKFVLMGGCWPETYKDYLDLNLSGHFLSIIESTDPHGTCNKIFIGRKNISSYEEIALNTGLSHGFIYKGYKEWIDPIMQWSNKR